MTMRKETVSTFKAVIGHAPASCFALTGYGPGLKNPRMIREYCSPEVFALPLPVLSGGREYDILGERFGMRNPHAARVPGCRNHDGSDEQLESGGRDVFV